MGHEWGTAPDFVGPRHAAREQLLLERLCEAEPGTRILNVGAGQGTFTVALERQGFDVTSSDLSPVACDVLSQRVSGPVVRADAASLPFQSGTFDAVVAGEVLEHLEDDTAALREIARVLAPEGVLAVSVPAHPTWFGSSDEWAGHWRRYDRDTLEARLRGAGFSILDVVPWGFPVAAAYHRFLYDKLAARLSTRTSSNTVLSAARKLLAVALLADRPFVGVERGCLGFIAVARYTGETAAAEQQLPRQRANGRNLAIDPNRPLLRTTTERHDPDTVQTDEERVIDALHQHAYAATLHHCSSTSRVLDVGFGEGYGAAIIAPHVRRYVGVEVETAAVAHARAKYRLPNVEFHLYDGDHLPFDDASFGLVVSFQVIEHVQNPARFVRELRRVLQNDGVVLVTTPNRAHRLADDERPWNRYHVCEYTVDELKDVMTEGFSSVEIHGVHGSELMEELERARVKRARTLARVDALGLRYMVPERFDTRLRWALRRLRGKTRRPFAASEIGLQYVHTSVERAREGLDLMAVGRP